MDKNNTMNVLENVTKIAANLSEAKKETSKPQTRNSDDSNNASTGSQNIQIHMDAGKKKEQKPVEKHIHEFPENRALTEQECELALKKAQMEYELKKSEQEYSIKVDQRNWAHKLEVEKKNEKRNRIRNIVAGIIGAISVGGICYGIFADYRDHKRCSATPRLPEPEPVKTDGTVE